MNQPLTYEDLELREVEYDALREISNIGMGHAATALNQMIGKTVILTIPEVALVSLKDLPDFVGGTEKIVIGIYLKVWGDVTGDILMVFPRKSALALCALLTGGAPEDELVLSEMHSSALREIGNILASSYLAALERLLGKTLIPSVPGIAFDMAGAVVDYILIQVGEAVDQTLVIKAAFKGNDHGVKGNFYLMPDPNSLKIILDAAKMLASQRNGERNR